MFCWFLVKDIDISDLLLNTKFKLTTSFSSNHLFVTAGLILAQVPGSLEITNDFSTFLLEGPTGNPLPP